MTETTGASNDKRDRLEILERVSAEPPRVHPEAPGGWAWRTSRTCYEFLAAEVAPGYRTLETGAGLSTVLFAAWGCVHTAVVPSQAQADTLEQYCSDKGFDTGGLTFDVRPSERGLPALLDDGPLDLILIDGGHSFPLPVIDWFYGAARLRAGGVAVFDDVPLPAVGILLNEYLDRDPRWERIAGTRRWRAYRRHSEGTLSEHESNQLFFRGPVPQLRDRIAWRTAALLPARLRRRVLPQ